jgi:hypothetical protein
VDRAFLSRIPKAWKLAISLFGIPGLYIGLVSVMPIVTIDPQNLLHQEQPFSFPIRVSNAGYVGINSVEFECLIDDVEIGHNKITNNLAHEPVDFQIGDLARGGYAMSGCAMPDLIQGDTTFKRGHITITLTLRPDFSPFKMHRTFYLTGLPDDRSHAHWMLTSR